MYSIFQIQQIWLSLISCTSPSQTCRIARFRWSKPDRSSTPSETCIWSAHISTLILCRRSCLALCSHGWKTWTLVGGRLYHQICQRSNKYGNHKGQEQSCSHKSIAILQRSERIDPNTAVTYQQWNPPTVDHVYMPPPSPIAPRRYPLQQWRAPDRWGFWSSRSSFYIREGKCSQTWTIFKCVCVFGCCTVAYDFIHLYYSHLSVCVWLLFTLSHSHIT